MSHNLSNNTRRPTSPTVKQRQHNTRENQTTKSLTEQTTIKTTTRSKMFPPGSQASVSTPATGNSASSTLHAHRKEDVSIGSLFFCLEKDRTSHVIFTAQSEVTETNGQHIVQRQLQQQRSKANDIVSEGACPRHDQHASSKTDMNTMFSLTHGPV